MYVPASLVISVKNVTYVRREMRTLSQIKIQNDVTLLQSTPAVD